MSSITAIKTRQGFVYDVIATDHQHRVLRDDDTLARKIQACIDAPFYFIRLIDMYSALSAERLPKHAEIIVYRKCPIYYLNDDGDVFAQVTSVEDHCPRTLYIRYDRCFHIMHAWLGQVIAYRKETKQKVPAWMMNIEKDLDSNLDYGGLVSYMLKMERVCSKMATLLDKADKGTTVRANPDYRRAVKKIGEFLHSYHLTFESVLQTKHPLAYLHQMPFANFIFQGFLLHHTNHFTEIRRPRWQQHVFLPMFKEHLIKHHLVLEPEEVLDLKDGNAFLFITIENEKTGAADKTLSLK